MTTPRIEIQWRIEAKEKQKQKKPQEFIQSKAAVNIRYEYE